MPATRKHLITLVLSILTLGFAVGATAGCTPAAPDESHQATLRVHVGMFGGPARPNGGMALQDSPASGENVTAVDDAGDEFTALTDAQGVAVLHLRPGRYTVYSTYCGPHSAIALPTGQVRRVQIGCQVR
jgi:hypothetical protein